MPRAEYRAPWLLSHLPPGRDAFHSSAGATTDPFSRTNNRLQRPKNAHCTSKTGWGSSYDGPYLSPALYIGKAGNRRGPHFLGLSRQTPPAHPSSLSSAGLTCPLLPSSCPRVGEEGRLHLGGWSSLFSWKAAMFTEKGDAERLGDIQKIFMLFNSFLSLDLITSSWAYCCSTWQRAPQTSDEGVGSDRITNTKREICTSTVLFLSF